MFEIREAKVEDTDQIIELIKELALYEKMLDKVIFTKETFKASIFEKKYANALVCEFEGRLIAYAIYYYSFSTFVGKGGIYLEDIYVKNEFRNKKIGQKILKILAQKCKDNDLARLEWVCLKWNKPSLAFYKKIGAKTLDEWVGLRVDEENLEKLSSF